MRRDTEYLKLQFVDINADIPPYELPLSIWSDAKNVRPVDGAMEKCKGYSQVFGTPSIAPYFVIPVIAPTVVYWIYANLTGIYATDGTTHYNITPAAGVTATLNTLWNGGVFNGLLVLNNGADNPIWWNGNTGSVMTDLTAWPANTKAKIIRPYKNFLVGMYITKSSTTYQDMVKWSDAASAGSVPASWDETDATKDAGEFLLSSKPGMIIDGLALRDSFIIYKSGSCSLMQYVGGHYIFNSRDLFSNVGLLAANCVTEFNGNHLVLTDGDIVVHNTQTVKSIADRRIKKWIFNQISADNYQRSFVFHNRVTSEIWICFPEEGQELANKAVIWNYNLDQFGFRDLPAIRFAAPGVVDASSGTEDWDNDTQSWDSDTTGWGQPRYNPTADGIILADYTNTKLHQLDQTNQDDGVDMTAYLIRESMPLLDIENIKFIKAVWPKITADAGTEILIRIGTQMHPEESIAWGDASTFTVGTDRKIDVLAKGRYISIRFRTVSDVAWRIESFDVEVEQAEKW